MKCSNLIDYQTHLIIFLSIDVYIYLVLHYEIGAKNAEFVITNEMKGLFVKCIYHSQKEQKNS